MNLKNRILASSLAFAACALPGFGLNAQTSFFSKPLTILVPLPPGGVPDALARVVAAGLQERIHQPVIVTNKAGANTRIAAEACASAKPDGDTLCLLTASTLSTNPFLFKELRYSPEKSFKPVANLVTTDVLLAVGAGVPANNWQELVANAKANPGKLAYASVGIGSEIHLTMEMLKSRAGIDILHVPFLGFPPILQSLGSGDVQIAYVGVGNPGVVDLVKTGKLKAIAVNSPQRSALLPDVPTFAEAGMPKLEPSVWFGLLAPAGTPDDVVNKLNTEINAVLASPALVERARTLAVTPMPGTPAAFAEFLDKDRAAWGQLVKATGAKLD